MVRVVVVVGLGVVVVVVVKGVVDWVAGEVRMGLVGVLSVSAAGLLNFVFFCNRFHQGMVVFFDTLGAGVVEVEGVEVVIWFHQVLNTCCKEVWWSVPVFCGWLHHC